MSGFTERCCCSRTAFSVVVRRVHLRVWHVHLSCASLPFIYSLPRREEFQQSFMLRSPFPRLSTTTLLKSMTVSPSRPAKQPRLSSPSSTSATTTSSASASMSTSTPSSSSFLVQLDPAHPGASLPTRGSALAAGYDLYSSETLTLPARGGRKVVQTGIRIKVPSGTYGRVAPRSGLAVKHGIDVGAGVVDEDYRGLLGVLLFNFGEEDFTSE